MFIGIFILITTIISTITFQVRRASAHSHDSEMHEVMKSEDVQRPQSQDNSWFDRSATSPCGPGNTIRDQEPKSALDIERE